MATDRHLAAVSEPGSVPTAEALASFLRHLVNRRGLSGRITSPETVRSCTSAVAIAFAGINHLAGLARDEHAEAERAGGDRERLYTNIRTAWGAGAPAMFNAKRAAVGSALAAARADEVLGLDVTDLDRANRRARTIRKGAKADDLRYDICTARMIGRLLGRRRVDPVFLSIRRAPEDGTARSGQFDPGSRRLRMTYRTAERHLDVATSGWDLHDLRHSRLTHAGEDGATESDLMNLSGREDRRTLQRYLKTSEEGTHRRLDEIDAHRGAWTLSAEEFAPHLT